jgi:hypothetical protein
LELCYQRHGRKYSRCFGGIGPILPMAIAGFEYYFLIGTMLVKITDDNAKAQVQKH